MQLRTVTIAVSICGLLIVCILTTVIGIVLTDSLRRSVKYRMLADKHLRIIDVYDKWLKHMNDGGNLLDFFNTNGYRRIGIYGLGYLGRRLVSEVQNSEVEICFVIDKNMKTDYMGIPILSLDDNISDVDAIIVTPIDELYLIKKRLNSLTYVPIVSIEEIFI